MKYLLVYLFLFLGFWANAQDPKNFNGYLITGLAQGTTYQIKYFAPQFMVKKSSIDSLFLALDQSLSIYKQNSTISLFNKKETANLQIDTHLKNVVKESFKVSKLTKGYFDITVLPLVNLWGFGPKGYTKNPSKQEVDSTLKITGYTKLKLKGNILKKSIAGVSIDVNGIAQGYSVDVIADYLEQHGIQNYIIEIGGEIKTKGKKPTGDFMVEIHRPGTDAGNMSHRILAKNIAITTSGNYEKRRDYNGQFISHHIDPRNGYPLQNNIVSVTVIAKTAMQADALDNYFMYLPPEKSIEFAEKLKDIAIHIIFNDNNIMKELQSSKFNNYIYHNQSKPIITNEKI